ncbi:4a-hydroxytetrahydrobiopterin dehydratase [Tahibacter amnicola]|uniref:Putative pterin-4-alpha-carbinolamine dehydratase n=1 Tax=Tahibacter amnicola TaxID=2976241 RepID=A0ABY6BAN9_9GAMM|nr:4a-hydroxytetrahydrobiopterin dehydratase [Tahibacter amnicola]UXI67131.1 4a-hydroxytetrahydrobiopterin dehydratase [Tahibacter amnicola]
MTKAELIAAHCQPRKGAEHALDRARCETLCSQVDGWALADDGKSLHKAFRFEDFHRTMGFVNAVAYMANREDHHPDMEVGYNYCRMRWSTHDVGGISLNDFVCAAKVDALLAG